MVRSRRWARRAQRACRRRGCETASARGPAMSTAYQRQDRAAGVFILFSLICGAGFVVAAGVQNQWFIPRVTYHTTVHDGGTLRPGAPILYSGIEIGRLGQITLNEGSGISVELKILA